MTNNPTIDGVSRELLPCPLCGSNDVLLAWDVYDTDRGRRTQSQIRCLSCSILTKTFNTHADARSYWNSRPLFDAPAVERQDPVSVLSREIRVLERLNASIDARQKRIEALNGEPEVAALQRIDQSAPFYISIEDWDLLVRGDIAIANTRVSREKRGKFTEPLYTARQRRSR